MAIGTTTDMSVDCPACHETIGIPARVNNTVIMPCPFCREPIEISIIKAISASTNDTATVARIRSIDNRGTAP